MKNKLLKETPTWGSYFYNNTEVDVYKAQKCLNTISANYANHLYQQAEYREAMLTFKKQILEQFPELRV